MTTWQEHFPLQAEERPLCFESDITNPLVLFNQEYRRLVRQQQAESDQLLAQLALSAFQIHRAAAELAPETNSGGTREALAIIASNLDDLLSKFQVRLEDLTHQAWTPQRRTEVQARGYAVCDALTEPRIAHMESPVIYRGQRLLAKGVATIEGPPRA